MKTAMTLQFWGVRGSIPTPGPTTVRYGGNTACISVDLGHGTLLVLDAGTGMRTLGEYLADEDTDIFSATVACPLGPYPGIPVFCPALSTAPHDLYLANPHGAHPVVPNP